MQTSAREKMPDLARIERRALSKNDFGDAGFEFEPALENVPVRVAFYSDAEANTTTEAIAQGLVKLVFPAGTDIRQSDRVVINGDTFAVVGLIMQRSFEITRNVEAKKMYV